VQFLAIRDAFKAGVTIAAADAISIAQVKRIVQQFKNLFHYD